MEEVIHARGHANVTAEHASTFEVTTDDYLTPAGDCILAVDADRAPADFDDAFVAACREPGATITCTVEAGGHADTAIGVGHPDLAFDSGRSMVGRTSDYVDDRTVMLASSISAAGFDRDLVAALAAGADVTVTLAVE
ncbi:DUF371 domain-containing protein [Haloarchaeobius salinus]|uniref:DUF371 domain-containing protein n=1 Tax=Haloarchaeobius salinus TaxID=1198298 RepID=UPI00210EDC91|nr:DUF371 domain-containing protein [Haloarchaeobius salinus]